MNLCQRYFDYFRIEFRTSHLTKTIEFNILIKDLFGVRLVVGLWFLVPPTGVRIPNPEPSNSFKNYLIFKNNQNQPKFWNKETAKKQRKYKKLFEKVLFELVIPLYQYHFKLLQHTFQKSK